MVKLRKEIQITLPLTIEEYNIGQLYTVIQMSKDPDGTKLKIFENEDVVHEDYGACRRTRKKMDLSNKVPFFISVLLPKKFFIVDELSYNFYPECRTFYKSEIASEDTFSMLIHSMHLLGIENKPFNDSEVVKINLADKIYDKKFDVLAFENSKSKKIHLKYDWLDLANRINSPLMTCHKLVEIQISCIKEEFLANKIFNELINFLKKVHQRIYSTVDQWIGLTMEDIRKMEEEVFFKGNK